MTQDALTGSGLIARLGAGMAGRQGMQMVWCCAEASSPAGQQVVHGLDQEDEADRCQDLSSCNLWSNEGAHAHVRE